MCCFTARRASARPRSPGSSPARWASASAPPPGPVIAKSGDLAALLTNLEDGDVLFIDEIHRLNPAVEEVLYPAMEDRALDLMIGEGPSARSVRIDLPRFTLIGATTRQGLLTTPLRDRFGIPVRLNFYTRRGAGAGRPPRRPPAQRADSPTTARMRSPAARAARRASPAACSAGCAISPMPSGADTIDAERRRPGADRLEIDGLGLDAMDRRYLTMIADLYGGGPVGRRNARRGPQRAARHDRGRDRALPHSARPHRPHRTRPLPQRPRLDPPRAQPARRAARPACSTREPSRSDATSRLLALPPRSPRRPPPPSRPPAAARLFEAGELAVPAGPQPTSARAPLPTTALNPNGYGSIGRSTVAKNPPIDCFYVYPTVSRDQRLNSDLVPDNAETRRGAGPVRALRRRLPDLRAVYRQMTVGAVAAAAAGADVSAAGGRSPMATSPPPGATISRATTRAARSCSSATARAR